VIALSVVTWKATDRAGSLVVAVTLHFWTDALFEVPRRVDGPAWPTYLVFGLSLIFWSVLLRLWSSPQGREPALA
jgi:hypothetical protein